MMSRNDLTVVNNNKAERADAPPLSIGRLDVKSSEGQCHRRSMCGETTAVRCFKGELAAPPAALCPLGGVGGLRGQVDADESGPSSVWLAAAPVCPRPSGADSNRISAPSESDHPADQPTAAPDATTCQGSAPTSFRYGGAAAGDVRPPLREVRQLLAPRGPVRGLACDVTASDMSA